MKYYKLIDIGKKKKYIFLPVLNSKCETIINKINRKQTLSPGEKQTIYDNYLNIDERNIIGKTNLTSSEKQILKNSFNNIKTIENLESYDIIKTAIYEDDTIEIIKKKLMIHLEYDLNKILLLIKLGFLNSSNISS